MCGNDEAVGFLFLFVFLGLRSVYIFGAGNPNVYARPPFVNKLRDAVFLFECIWLRGELRLLQNWGFVICCAYFLGSD